MEGGSDLVEARASLECFIDKAYNQKRLHSALGYTAAGALRTVSAKGAFPRAPLEAKSGAGRPFCAVTGKRLCKKGPQNTLYPDMQATTGRERTVPAISLEGQEEFNQVLYFAGLQVETHAAVVMDDHVSKCWKPAVVVEAAFLVREQAAERRCAVPLVWSAVCLKAVDADLGGRMEIPSRLGP